MYNNYDGYCPYNYYYCPDPYPHLRFIPPIQFIHNEQLTPPAPPPPPPPTTQYSYSLTHNYTESSPPTPTTTTTTNDDPTTTTTMTVPPHTNTNANIMKTTKKLACLFCRARKIACGPPPTDCTDNTCK